MSSRFGNFFIGFFVGLSLLILAKVMSDGVATFANAGTIVIPLLDFLLNPFVVGIVSAVLFASEWVALFAEKRRED
jgi:hypothetical protein